MRQNKDVNPIKVEWWPIEKIIPYESNPRRNEKAVQSVANSIIQFGWRQPVVVDFEGIIIAGHTRLMAAQSLNLRDIPVCVASDLTPEQVQAYRLADNKTSELAEWDLDLLELELDKIADNFQMEDFGFEFPDTISDEKETHGDSYCFTVTCNTEEERAELIEKLKNDGYECKRTKQRKKKNE